VGVINDPTDVSTFTTLQTITLAGHEVWNEQLVYFVDYSEGDGQIAFMVGSLDEENYSIVLIDDVEISLAEPVYNVTFKVHNSNLDPIAGASIEIEGEGTIITHSNGEATHGLHNGHYQFTVNADNYESFSGDFSINNDHLTLEITMLTVNVEENFTEGIILYPNPFDDQFHIRNAENFSNLIVSNVTGQKILEKKLTGDQFVRINTSAWVKGVYFVQLQYNNGLSTVRIIIKN
jgi:hypothetical protein